MRGHWSARLESALGALAARCYARPGATLAIAAVLTLLLGTATTRLHVDADLASLLPRRFPSVQALDDLKGRFGGVGYVVVVGRGAPAADLRRFADELAPRLEALPTIRYAEHRRPVAFFRDRALYYLSVTALSELEARLQSRVRQARGEMNPVVSADRPRPALWSDDLVGLDRQRLRWIEAELDRPYYMDASATTIAILAKPTGLSTDLAFARRTVAEVATAVAELDPSAYGGIEVALTGRYQKHVDQHDQIVGDLQLASALAGALVLLFMLAHFRHPLAVVAVAVPVVLALVWSYGAAALLFGRLSILTGFLGAILVGLGIDHGIHLLSRWLGERAAGRPADEVVRLAFGETGRAVVVAGATTAVALAGVAASEFRAFREFGVTAAIGVALVLVAYVTVLPALLAWLPLGGAAGHGGAGRLAHGWAGLVVQRPRAVLALGTTGAAVLLAFAPQLTFDTDFASLEDAALPSYVLDAQVNDVLGYSQTPLVVLTATAARAQAVAAHLRREQDRRGRRSTIDFVVASGDLVPQAQDAKREVLQRLAALGDELPWAELPKPLQDRRAQAERTLQAEPFTAEDLPIEVRRRFAGEGQGGAVMVFPRVTLTDARGVQRLADEVRAAAAGDDVVAGEAVILADIATMAQREAPPILTATVLGILLCVLLLAGGGRPAAVTLSAGALTLFGLAGALPLTGLELNYLNMVLVPVIFGLAIDGGAHLAMRARDERPPVATLAHVGRAVAAAILTTGCGFGALIVADHHGLRSFGEVALVGLAVNLWLCGTLLPAAVALSWRRRGSPPPNSV